MVTFFFCYIVTKMHNICIIYILDKININVWQDGLSITMLAASHTERALVGSNLARANGRQYRTSIKLKTHKMNAYKRGLLNSFLFHASRNIPTHECSFCVNGSQHSNA